jgi:hypothetical protein
MRTSEFRFDVTPGSAAPHEVARAREVCSEANTLEVLQWVVAAVTAGCATADCER